MRLPVILSSLVIFAACSVARADIVTSLTNNAPVKVASGYAYTYDVQLVGGKLDATTGGTNPNPLQFGTIYDFGPATFTGATGLLQSSFIFTFANITNPSAYKTVPGDDPNIQNVRYSYNGTSNVSAQDLGSFTLISPYAMTVNGGVYDGQSYKTSNNSIQGNVGQLDIPTVPSSVTPEPSSLILLGTGLLGMAGTLRRRFV